MENKTKKCTICNESKPLSEYRKHFTGSLYHKCKACVKIAAQAGQTRRYAKKVNKKSSSSSITQAIIKSNASDVAKNQANIVSSFILTGMPFSFTMPSVNLSISNI